MAHKIVKNDTALVYPNADSSLQIRPRILCEPAIRFHDA